MLLFRISSRIPPLVGGREFLHFTMVKVLTFSWCLKYQKEKNWQFNQTYLFKNIITRTCNRLMNSDCEFVKINTNFKLFLGFDYLNMNLSYYSAVVNFILVRC